MAPSTVDSDESPQVMTPMMPEMCEPYGYQWYDPSAYAQWEQIWNHFMQNPESDVKGGTPDLYNM